MTAQEVMDELGKHEDPSSAQFAARFFKTGPGEYGEGDVFIRRIRNFHCHRLSNYSKVIFTNIGSLQ